MSIELPLYRQEKPNTCALACLRMVLTAYGTNVDESVLEAQAVMEPAGTHVEELERLARVNGLAAEVRETNTEDVRRILANGGFPIAYIDRSIFDLSPAKRPQHPFRNAKIHTVIPSRVTNAFVTYHDPRPPNVIRRTIRLFEQAHARMAFISVVCSNTNS